MQEEEEEEEEEEVAAVDQQLALFPLAKHSESLNDASFFLFFLPLFSPSYHTRFLARALLAHPITQSDSLYDALRFRPPASFPIRFFSVCCFFFWSHALEIFMSVSLIL